MARRIIYNILLAFIAFPALMLVQGYFGRYVLQDHHGFNGDFFGYTISILHDIVPVISLGLLFFVLFPYNAILFFYYQKKGKGLTFILKVLLFLFIVLFILIAFGAGWLLATAFVIKTGFKTLFFLLLFSILIVSCHYWLIDRKTEKTKP